MGNGILQESFVKPTTVGLFIMSMTMTHGMSGLGRTAYDSSASESQKQGSTVVEDSRLVQMLQALTSLTDDKREVLAELLKKMG